MIYTLSMKMFISAVSWVIFFFFCGLTALVFISQNSAPGDKTYPVKIGFEKALVKTSKFMNAEVDVQITLTKRRVKETEKVIDTAHGSESLTNLSNQVTTTEQTILSINDPQKQQKAAKEYVTTLTVAQTSLENEKQEIVQKEEVPPTPLPTSIPSVVQPSPTPTIRATAPSVPSPTPLPPAIHQPPPITTQITQTQEQIQNTITTLNKIANKPEKERPEKDEKIKDKEKENKPEGNGN